MAAWLTPRLSSTLLLDFRIAIEIALYSKIGLDVSGIYQNDANHVVRVVASRQKLLMSFPVSIRLARNKNICCESYVSSANISKILT